MLWVHPLVTRDGRTEIGERVQLVGEPDAEYTVIRSVGEPGHGAKLLVLTDLTASRGRIVTFDLDAGGQGKVPVTVIAESDDVISDVIAAGDQLLVERLDDASPRFHRYARWYGTGACGTPAWCDGLVGRFADPPPRV